MQQCSNAGMHEFANAEMHEAREVPHEMNSSVVYKIVPAELWRASEAAGQFAGSAVDLRDGFIHFSTADQVSETASKHFAGTHGLLLVAVSTVGLDVRWEPSRGGDLFPHLYRPLPLDAVISIRPLPLGDDGRHQFPDLLP